MEEYKYLLNIGEPVIYKGRVVRVDVDILNQLNDDYELVLLNKYWLDLLGFEVTKVDNQTELIHFKNKEHVRINYSKRRESFILGMNVRSGSMKYESKIISLTDFLKNIYVFSGHLPRFSQDDIEKIDLDFKNQKFINETYCERN